MTLFVRLFSHFPDGYTFETDYTIRHVPGETTIRDVIKPLPERLKRDIGVVGDLCNNFMKGIHASNVNAIVLQTLPNTSMGVPVSCDTKIPLDEFYIFVQLESGFYLVFNLRTRDIMNYPVSPELDELFYRMEPMTKLQIYHMITNKININGHKIPFPFQQMWMYARDIKGIEALGVNIEDATPKYFAAVINDYFHPRP